MAGCAFGYTLSTADYKRGRALKTYYSEFYSYPTSRLFLFFFIVLFKIALPGAFFIPIPQIIICLALIKKKTAYQNRYTVPFYLKLYFIKNKDYTHSLFVSLFLSLTSGFRTKSYTFYYRLN